MKFTKLILLAILLTTTSCAYDEDDNLVNTAFFNEVEVITTDSELFENLKQIATNEERPDQNITCINFNYP